MQKRCSPKSKNEIIHHLNAQKRSNLSGLAYCRKHKISYSSFRNWITGKSKLLKKRSLNRVSPPIFQKVEVKSILPQLVSDSRFELVFDSHKLFIPQEFKEESLKKLACIFGFNK